MQIKKFILLSILGIILFIATSFIFTYPKWTMCPLDYAKYEVEKVSKQIEKHPNKADLYVMRADKNLYFQKLELSLFEQMYPEYAFKKEDNFLSDKVSILNDYKKAKELDTKDDIYLKIGILEFEANDIENAIEDLTKSIRNNQNHLAYYYRGLCYIKLDYFNSPLYFNHGKNIEQHSKNANDDLSKSIALNPKFDLAYSYRGLTQSEYNKQIEDFTKAIKLNPKNPIHYHRRINANLHHIFFDYVNNNEEIENYKNLILKDIQKAIKLKPTYAHLYSEFVSNYVDLDTEKTDIFSNEFLINLITMAIDYDEIGIDMVNERQLPILKQELAWLYFVRGDLIYGSRMHDWDSAIKDMKKSYEYDEDEEQNFVHFFQAKQNLYNNPKLKNYTSKKPDILKDFEITKIENCQYMHLNSACITIENTTGKTYNNVAVIVDLLDSYGNAISDSRDLLKKFQPNSEHTFKIPLYKDSKGWELSDIKIMGEM